MNTSQLVPQEESDPAVSIGVWTVLASLAVGALLYLGSYSMGPEFIDRTPQLNPAVVTR